MAAPTTADARGKKTKRQRQRHVLRTRHVAIAAEARGWGRVSRNEHSDTTATLTSLVSVLSDSARGVHVFSRTCCVHLHIGYDVFRALATGGV
jgi:hypothetical protein